MKPARLAMLVVGVLLAIPAAAAIVGGGTLLGIYLFERDSDGYLDVTLERIETETSAVTAEEIDLRADPADVNWLLDLIDLDVRVRATAAASDRALFVGVADEGDVDTFLAGVAHDEIVDVDDDLDVDFRRRTGTAVAGVPGSETFWETSAEGLGTQEIVWEPRAGNWAVVVMNADGSPAIGADVNVGVEADQLAALLVGPILFGLALGALSVWLVIAGTRGGAADSTIPPPAEPGPLAARQTDPSVSPVHLEATLDPELSNWYWLIKWVTAIPHFVVLIVLWLAFPFLTFFAGVAILFTGRYPRGLFDITEGILRWTWRVSYYAANGGIGSDEYPPFSLRELPGDHATLRVRYPDRLDRPLVLVKWLLALPHLIIVGILVGGSLGWSREVDYVFGGGLLGLLALAAGVTLLLTKRYPEPLFDLIIGLNRWVYRTIAYVALMTDDYPPFRLDQGPTEPRPEDPSSPDASMIDMREDADARGEPTPSVR